MPSENILNHAIKRAYELLQKYCDLIIAFEKLYETQIPYHHVKHSDVLKQTRYTNRSVDDLMSKNKRKGLQIKIFVKGFFPKSSAWPNYHNKIMERDQNSLLFWNRSVIELAKNKSRTTKIAYNFTCKDNNDICNSDIQRLLTSAKYLLFLSGDVELNPVPLQSPPMLLLSKRLAELGREVVSIVGDGNCFFRSVSHQLSRTFYRKQYTTVLVAIFTKYVEIGNVGRSYNYTSSR